MGKIGVLQYYSPYVRIAPGANGTYGQPDRLDYCASSFSFRNGPPALISSDGLPPTLHHFMVFALVTEVGPPNRLSYFTSFMA
ncbi:hypothetical protein AVEN_204905-1 [Araneus ventricosus]|uniref:Uncharacterized protein n=1 Tax=Araneus ventricosus TaxID=182803 RepID=A0A4Y2L4T3_ARAVE|nr:hypothetical protein AVEN_204905-1 [Araneus ventricosus]